MARGDRHEVGAIADPEGPFDRGPTGPDLEAEDLDPRALERGNRVAGGAPRPRRPTSTTRIPITRLGLPFPRPAGG